VTKENIKLGLSCAAALFGFIAGVLWLFASLQNVKPTDQSKFASELLISLPNIGGEDSDVLATSARQSYWNGWAALAASVAAMCQIPLAFM
jgi:hypothetical protein